MRRGLPQGSHPLGCAGMTPIAGISAFSAGILDDRQMTNEQLRPILKSLETIANLPGSNAETRSYVRLLKARLAE